MKIINCYDYVILPKNSGLEKYKSIIQEFKLNGKETINIRGKIFLKLFQVLLSKAKK